MTQGIDRDSRPSSPEVALMEIATEPGPARGPRPPTPAVGVRPIVLPGKSAVVVVPTPRPGEDPRAFELTDTHLRRILDELQDGVYVTDLERRVHYWNRGAERISGWSAEEVVGRRCSDNILIHVDEAGAPLCLTGCPLSAVIADGAPREAQVYLHHRDGHRVSVLVRVQPLKTATGRTIGAVETFTDRTTQMAALRQVEELQALAFIDPLTGVGNRRHAEQTLTARLEELRRYGWSFAVLFIDIDHFKDVNDEYGHEVGDRVLRMVARTLAGSLRSFDFLGRWGGEEFLCVVPMQIDTQLAPLATRCRALVEGSSLRVGDRSISVTISLGATMAFPSDTVEGLVRRVDHLMYQSKAAGRNRVTLPPGQVFRPSH